MRMAQTREGVMQARYRSTRVKLNPWLLAGIAALALATGAATAPTLADETCQSPYMTKITGEEDFVYVWALGEEGVGDGSDKLVTVDVRKNSPTFGKVIRSASVGGRHEAHHGGFTDDRRQFWAAGLSDSKIFIFDVASDPAAPKLVKTIDDFVEKSGGAPARTAPMRSPAAC